MKTETWTGTLRRLKPVLLAVMVLVASGCGERNGSDGGDVTVPRVVGLPLTLATGLLVDSGLRWKLRGSDAVHSNAHAGRGDQVLTVVGQAPSAGKSVTPSRVVELTTR